MKIWGLIVSGLMGVLWNFVGNSLGLPRSIIILGAVPIGGVTMAIFIGAMK